MNIQVGIPRPIFNIHEHPKYIHIHTLARLDVSAGGVLLNGTVDPEHGVRGTKQLEPMVTYQIEGEDGFEGYEYVLPFWELFQQRRQISASKLAYYGAQGYGSRELVPFTTGGFTVTAQSAFRSSPSTYEEHTVSFQILMPVTGGGILRLADCSFDLSNPTFDPYSPHPRAIRNLDVERMLNQSHQAKNSTIEDRRVARIQAAEQSMAKEELRLPGGNRALPPRRT